MSTETQKAASEGEVQTADDFASLLQQEIKPRTDQAKERVDSAVRTLAQQALADSALVSEDVYATIDAMKAAIDKKLSEQLDQILHHDDFQKLESAWRGLHYLVQQVPTAKDLKIKVLNVERDEVRKTLRQYKGAAWDQSPLFKRIYEAEFGTLGGQPFSAVVCDYYFDHTGPDVEMMQGLAKIGSAAHVPFISACSPNMLQMDNWTELANPRSLEKLTDAVDYANWRTFRDSEDSQYLALTMPRFLGRPPYGAKSEPVEEFDYEEETDGRDHGSYLWVNSAYAMAANIGIAFKEYGWTTRIRGVQSGGLVEDLPTATFPTDDGDMDSKCPVEISIADRREAELSAAGFLPLIHRKNTNTAAFLGAQSCYKPKAYQDPDATSNEQLAARLPYRFAACRFAHYLKCMVRDQVGSSKEAPQLQRELTEWVMQYVDGQPDTSSEEVKATQPLREAKIDVAPDPENPGQYRAKFMFRPHYQLEGMEATLSMVSRLPGGE